jgi:hypothetical protein
MVLYVAILKGKILIPNEHADILYVPDKTSVKINSAEDQPGQPLKNMLLACLLISPFLVALGN